MTNQTTAGSFRRSNTYAMTMTALMTAVTCILAPLSIPIGPVPISLTNFAIYLFTCWTGKKGYTLFLKKQGIFPIFLIFTKISPYIFLQIHFSTSGICDSHLTPIFRNCSS